MNTREFNSMLVIYTINQLWFSYLKCTVLLMIWFKMTLKKLWYCCSRFICQFYWYPTVVSCNYPGIINCIAVGHRKISMRVICMIPWTSPETAEWGRNSNENGKYCVETTPHLYEIIYGASVTNQRVWNGRSHWKICYKCIVKIHP